MKKYLFILLSILYLGSCSSEDTSVDVTVMPPVTTTGANTFGCLIDGWVYVGGRYNNWDDYKEWTPQSFWYYENENDNSLSKLTARVSVKPNTYITFTIVSPQEGKEAVLTELWMEGDELEDGTAFISRFDKKTRIISGTFSNEGRLTNGRFDIHYSKTSESNFD